MDANARQNTEHQKTRVFISYSRKDRVFAEVLRDRLIGDGFDAYLDVHDIVKGEPWQERLQNLIFGADAVLFLISPDSVASEICDWEVNEAERLAKRVLPVMCRMTSDGDVPGRLKRLNYAFLDSDEKWAGEYPKLREALSRDIYWLREHTRLSELAARWARDGRPEAQLLRLDVVRDARKWEARRPPDAVLSDVLTAFLEASEDKEAGDRERLLTIIGRAYVKPASQAGLEQRNDEALRATAAGVLLSEDLEMRLVPEHDVRARFRRAAFDNRLCMRLQFDETCHSAFFNPAGTQIVTAGADRQALVWDVASATEIARVQGFKQDVSFAVFSPDGARIAIGSRDTTIRICDAVSGVEQFRWDHKLSVNSVRFSHDGAFVVSTGNDDAARVWSLSTGKEIARFDHKEGCGYAAFSPDGRRLVTKYGRGCVRVVDISSAKELFSLGKESVASSAPGIVRSNVEFSPDGASIIAGADDLTIRIWDANTGIEKARLRGLDSHAIWVCFDPTGSRILTGCRSGALQQWDAATGVEYDSFVGIEGVIHTCAYNADGTRIVAASGDHAVQVWDAAGSREVLRLSGCDQWTSGGCFSPDGERVVVCQTERTRVWNLTTGEAVGKLEGQADMNQAQYSPDGTRILTTSLSESQRHHTFLWDGETYEKIHSTVEPSNNNGLSPDGAKFITFPGQSPPRIRSSANGEEILSLQGYAYYSPSFGWSADGTRIAILHDDGAVRLWSATTGEVLAEHQLGQKDVRQIAFAPDAAKIILPAKGGPIVIWDLLRQQAAATLADSERARHAVFSPDGRRLVAASGSDIRVWDIATGQELLRHEDCGTVRLLSFSKDGAFLLIATGKDTGPRTVSVWDAETLGEVARLSEGHQIDHLAISADLRRVLGVTTNYGSLTTLNVPRVWDTSRLRWLTGSPPQVLACQLTAGRGRCTPRERRDVLMQSAPNDLYEALMQCLTPAQRENVVRRAEVLNRTLHPNCYLPPSLRPGYEASAQAKLVVDDAEPAAQTAPRGTAPQPRHEDIAKRSIEIHTRPAAPPRPDRRGVGLAALGWILLAIASAIGVGWLILRQV